jgi:SNF2 family DNA or RNA helicase
MDEDILLHIDHDGEDFVVTHAGDAELKQHLEALLSARYIPDLGKWRLDWWDIQSLKARLDAAGRTEGRGATDAAIEAFEREASLDSIAHEASRDGSPLDAPLITTNLYSDQRAGVRFVLHRPGIILADAMGSGKSLMLLTAYSKLREMGEVGPLLVLCPNSVKPAWVKEVKKHSSLKVAMIGNTRKEQAATLSIYQERPTDVFVVHYDCLISHDTKRKQPWSEVVDQLVKIPFAAIVCDEAHHLKNSSSKRTIAARFLVSASNSKKRRTRIWLATGTPVSESPVDAYSLLGMVEPSVLPSHTRFLGHFIARQAIQLGPRKIMQDAGPKNIPDLQRLFSRCMIRRGKADLKGFPDKVESTRDITLTGDQKKLYVDIKKGVYDTPEKEEGSKLAITTAMTRVIRLRQCLVSPKILSRDGDSAKLEALDTILEEVLSNEDEKILIWTEFRDAVDIIAERFAHYGVIKLYGGQTPEDMFRIGASWDTSPQRVAVAIPAFGGTGVDFLSRCRTAVYVDIPFSTVLFRQSLDRIHRRVNATATDKISLIKASPAHIIFLHAEDTVDDLVLGRVSEKGNLVDSILEAQAHLAKMSPEQILASLG